jgi:DNA-binding SARP family transcriptional activator
MESLVFLWYIEISRDILAITSRIGCFMPDLDAESSPEVNAALFCDFREVRFQALALTRVTGGQTAIVISDDPGFAPALQATVRLRAAEAGLDALPVDPEEVLTRLRERLARLAPVDCVVIDMTWAVSAAMGADSIAAWATIAERLCARPGVAVISVYDKELLIEDQLQAAFAAHQQFLAPSGLYENPHWLPTEIRRESTLDEKLGFMLGRVVPDFAGETLFRSYDRLAARGAAPDWAPTPDTLAPGAQGGARWHIYCLGPLRVFTGPKTEVEWRIPGGAPKKTKTLFAYLLNAGDKGAHADQICELLWQDTGEEAAKRARLHHTVAMLRKTLGGAETVLRSGDYYRLNTPPGSWIDIAGFEQLCRRGLSLARAEQNDAALRLYPEAEKLYRGDLFEDLPHDYLVTETEDWILPRRIWLREMAIRVRYDHSKLLRRYRRYGEALDQALKAVALDPTNEKANSEAMRVFHAQGRTDAMHRQFRQYQSAMAAIGEPSLGVEIRAVYDELCRSLDNLSPRQRKTKELVLR